MYAMQALVRHSLPCLNAVVDNLVTAESTEKPEEKQKARSGNTIDGGEKTC